MPASYSSMMLVKNPPCQPMSRDFRSMISSSPLSNQRPPHLLHASMTTASAMRRLIRSRPSTGHLRDPSPRAFTFIQHSPQKRLPEVDCCNSAGAKAPAQRKQIRSSTKGSVLRVEIGDDSYHA